MAQRPGSLLLLEISPVRPCDWASFPSAIGQRPLPLGFPSTSRSGPNTIKMGDAGFFKGTSADQDARFENKEKKLLKNTRFPAIFSTKVDFAKVNMDVMRQWIARQVTKYLHRDDEVVVDFVFELLEAADPDPRQMQISLTGFLERNTPAFMEELWTLCDSAQNNPSRIPQQFIDEQIKLAEAARAQRDAERSRIASGLARARDRGVDPFTHSGRRSRFSDNPSSDPPKVHELPPAPPRPEPSGPSKPEVRSADDRSGRDSPRRDSGSLHSQRQSHHSQRQSHHSGGYLARRDSKRGHSRSRSRSRNRSRNRNRDRSRSRSLSRDHHRRRHHRRVSRSRSQSRSRGGRESSRDRGHRGHGGHRRDHHRSHRHRHRSPGSEADDDGRKRVRSPSTSSDSSDSSRRHGQRGGGRDRRHKRERSHRHHSDSDEASHRRHGRQSDREEKPKRPSTDLVDDRRAVDKTVPREPSRERETLEPVQSPSAE